MKHYTDPTIIVPFYAICLQFSKSTKMMSLILFNSPYLIFFNISTILCIVFLKSVIKYLDIISHWSLIWTSFSSLMYLHWPVYVWILVNFCVSLWACLMFQEFHWCVIMSYSEHHISKGCWLVLALMVILFITEWYNLLGKFSNYVDFLLFIKCLPTVFDKMFLSLHHHFFCIWELGLSIRKNYSIFFSFITVWGWGFLGYSVCYIQSFY